MSRRVGKSRVFGSSSSSGQQQPAPADASSDSNSKNNDSTAAEGSSMRRSISSNFHRRFSDVRSYVNELGGSKKRVIEKVLIANNGVAAVKAIRSIRRWAYEVFGNERAISFVVMATPEDLRANAEYIRMGDVIVDVPGGSNNHNYANVTLIVELARLHGVHAVWAGWGHASENPTLPDTLARSEPPIQFIGPAGPPMRALGDKIGSTIIAQTAGVPCIAWNGSHVIAHYDKATGSLPDEAYDRASIASADEASRAASKIGFPVMIKASEGGGGKGIRRVNNLDDVPTAYRQVSGEVPGSPIFIMKLSEKSRHLEVQLLADEYGDAVALNGRDCSVQRRHQKIIEEGPPVAAPPSVWTKMERAAVALAKAVGYANAGTVEYLYSEPDSKFYFLELNPRLQVEHPVTEMITGVNLPAAQLQVAMGIPLHNIPDIREAYGHNKFEDEPLASSSRIDFDTKERNPPRGHCIAVRITAENAEAGFKPTSGGIQELNFRSTPSVWGYFSMDSSGSIHEFADSQFGHLFASGPDREQARRSMVLALKELSIRGDISTTVDYISRLIELDDFVNNEIDTGWLDALIKANVDGLGAPEANSAKSSHDLTGINIKPLSNHTYVVIGATVVAFDRCTSGENQFVDLLKKGQLPSQSLLSMVHNVELILDGTKYKMECTRVGPNAFGVALSGGDKSKFVMANIRSLSDGGFLIDVGGKSHVAYLTSRPDAPGGMKLNIGGATVAFSPDYDPTSLRTDVAGKLVKRLKEDGAQVRRGEPYAEIEVMKMYMPLKVEEAGVLHWRANEGAALAPGDLLANIELENPESVTTVKVFEGDMGVDGWGVENSMADGQRRPHLLLRKAVSQLEGGMAGYVLSDEGLQRAMKDMEDAVNDPSLPVFEILEQLSVLSGRIDQKLYSSLSDMIVDFRKRCESASQEERSQLRFEADEAIKLLSEHTASIADPSEKSAFIALTTPLKEAATPYHRAGSTVIPGAERALVSYLGLLREWIAVERWFVDKGSYADAVDSLRKAKKDDVNDVLRICRAHALLSSTVRIVNLIVDGIGQGGVQHRPVRRFSVVAGAAGLAAAVSELSEIESMGGNSVYSSVSLKARKLLLKESLPSINERKEKLWSAAKQVALLGSDSDTADKSEVDAFISQDVPISDVFFTALSEAKTREDYMGVIEVYARKISRTHIVDDMERNVSDRLLKFTFMTKTNEGVFSAGTPVTSMTDLTRVLSRSNSLTQLADTANEDTASLGHRRSQKVPPLTPRTGVCKVVDSLEDLESEEFFSNVLKSFPQFTESASKCSAGPVNVLYFVVEKQRLSKEVAASDAIAVRCEHLLRSIQSQLERADLRRVTFLFTFEADGEVDEYPLPAIFTFRVEANLKEDSLIRHIEPAHAYTLELTRLGENFGVKKIDSRQTATGHVHLYSATPKASALAKDKKANKAPRLFARALSFLASFSAPTFERTLVDSLNAIDICGNSFTGTGADNHLFIDLVSDFEKLVLDPVEVEQVIVAVLQRHGERISRLGIAELETKILCRLSEESPPISLRMVAGNPTGYVLVMNTYVEAEGKEKAEPVFKLIGGTKASLAGSGDTSWEGLKVSTPYPLTRRFDAQRKAAQKSSETLYCYDLPALFEAAVERQWINASTQGGIEGGIRAAGRPQMVVYTRELVVRKKSDPSKPWTMKDYLDGDLELVQSQRHPGGNDVGMVAWLMVLKTLEYPDGRQVVLIANDITHKAGSFGTKEDVVFKLASDYARQMRVPRIFVAANSGARIGTAEAIKKVYKVAFKDSNKPENGFDFLYLTKEDYDKLNTTKRQVIGTPVLYKGEEVYKVTDIIGIEPDLGVENLKGSGLIAGETSIAYNDIFTMTIVLGRTVGIGAYLVRLGQRTIQKTSASPIILTGFQALNKLMGVDVYSTNDQLGGPAIMYSNGVSHVAEPDHLRCIVAAVDWLSYVPSTRRGILPITDIRGIDQIDRPIDFTPSAGAPYDPRIMLGGGEDDDGVWQSGFFDRGSFSETLSGWAKSVVVGRARLGGIPMGVIATENRTVEAIKPADPADVKASEAIIQEAGCVWFPNSAYKTAQAINDFRTEDLPLMIFANWRGFSGGQRDMFDEVLKYGSLIVDAFVAYEQPIFVFIPPFAEIRGGAWVVLDASINAAVMEMYAASGSARGGVLEANGAASVKYRAKDLIATMHRVDDKLIELDAKLQEATESEKRDDTEKAVAQRENALLPVYEQIAVQFCELHDTPGRMKAVGVIERDVEWKDARNFFFWRLRRKLAEFDFRKKMQEAVEVGRGVKALSPLEASALMKQWFLQTPGMTEETWNNDRVMLSWMASSHEELERRILDLTKECVRQEVYQVMVAGGNTAKIGTAGIVEGISRACMELPPEQRSELKKMLQDALAKV